MTVLFWSLLGVIAYAYVGYPLTVAIAAWLLNRRVHKVEFDPTVSVVVAAHDEAEAIEERITNLLASDHPAEKLQIVIVSDGSTDETVARARAIADDRVVVLDLSRIGKAAALAIGARRADGDVLVFTDANTEFRPDAIRMLVRSFADPRVGGVVGRTGYRISGDTEASGRGEDLYWRYDTWLKELESRTGSVVSAHGGMYAIRRHLFREVEDPAVTDDFAISTSVVAQGKRLVFERDAIGFERPMARSGAEYRRRVRVMTRGLSGVVLRRALLNPLRYGFYSVAFASRKLVRRLVALALPPLFAATLVLAPRHPVYAALAAIQAAVVLLAGAGWALRRHRLGRLPVFYVPFFLALANAASAAAVWNVARGHRIERWTPHRHESPRRAREARPA